MVGTRLRVAHSQRTALVWPSPAPSQPVSGEYPLGREAGSGKRQPTLLPFAFARQTIPSAGAREF